MAKRQTSLVVSVNNALRIAAQAQLKRLIDPADLSDISRDDLAVRWQAIYGHPPPRGVRRGLLALAAAWHAQAKTEGGLSTAVLRQINASTHSDRVRSTKARHIGAQPGTRLVREWGGRTHVVDVGDKGCVWNGQPYPSLSAAARAITGARWSGPRFFGLKDGSAGR